MDIGRGTFAVPDPLTRPPIDGTAYKLNVYLIIPGSHIVQISALDKVGSTDYTVKATCDQISIRGEQGIISVYLPTPLVLQTTDVLGFYFYQQDIVPIGYDDVVSCDSNSSLQSTELTSAPSQGDSLYLSLLDDDFGQYICQNYSWELVIVETDLGRYGFVCYKYI
jgi:hypothetical protein